MKRGNPIEGRQADRCALIACSHMRRFHRRNVTKGGAVYETCSRCNSNDTYFHTFTDPLPEEEGTP